MVRAVDGREEGGVITKRFKKIYNTRSIIVIPIIMIVMIIIIVTVDVKLNMLLLSRTKQAQSLSYDAKTPVTQVLSLSNNTQLYHLVLHIYIFLLK